MLQISLNKKLICIDCSYVVFFKFYSVMTWCKLQKIDIDIQNILDNERFINKYDKMFEQALLDIVGDTHPNSWSNVILFKDAPRDTIWRNALFTDYKADREDKRQTFNGDIFKHTYTVLLPKLIEKYKELQVFGMENMEADDIIGVIKEIVRKKSPTQDILIITNDNDYIQLHDEYTKIINLKDHNICERLQAKVQIPLEKYIQYKIILGDKSDCIPAISKKIGEKTALKYVQNPDLLEVLFSKNGDAKQQYERNASLMDMRLIPLHIRELICDNISLVN